MMELLVTSHHCTLFTHGAASRNVPERSYDAMVFVMTLW